MEIIAEQIKTGIKINISREYNVVAVDGITPTSANINTTASGAVDGSFYNSSYLAERNIVITMVPEGDIEEKRLELYKIFPPKKKVILHIKTKKRKVYIECYVESLESNVFGIRQNILVSLLAPQPLFIDENKTEFTQSAISSSFEFDFEISESGVEFGIITKERDITIINEGEEITGLIIEIVANDTVINPVIYNKTTSEKFEIRTEMKKGDVITINTHRGQKKIERNREGQAENILNCIAKGTKWLIAEPGENTYSFACETGEESAIINYQYNKLYGGV